MRDTTGKTLIIAQTAKAARRVAERLLRRNRDARQIVVLLRHPEAIAGCCVRAWDDYVPEAERAAEVARVREAVDSAAERLRDAVTVHGLFLHSAWRSDFYAFFLDELVALACVVREVLRREQPVELHVAEDPGTRSWWTGRQRFADVAHALAADGQAGVRAAPGFMLRRCRDALLRFAALAASATWAARTMAGAALQALRGRRVEATSARGPRVLVALFGASELDIVAELQPELPRAGCAELQLVDLGFERTAQLARKRGLPIADLAAHTGLRSFLRGLRAPLSVWCAWRRLARDAAWRNAFGLPGVSLWPAAAPRAWATAIAEMTRTLVYGALAEELLDRAEPDVVVMFKQCYCVPAGLTLAARRRGIPTVYVQHGLLSDTFRTQPSLPHARFLVFSEHASDQIAAGGVAREAIEVVGHAGYDELARRRACPIDSPATSLGHLVTDGADVNSAGPTSMRQVLLLLTQPNEGLRGLAGGRWIEHAFAAAAQIPGCRLIVKMHPRDTRRAAYEALAAETGANARIVPHAEAKLLDLWPLCDAVAMGYSTAAFEAIIFGKPVVSINLTGDEDYYPFAASGAALAARTPDEILPALRAALTDEMTQQRLARERETFIQRHVGPLDGRAAERIASIIVAMARESSATRSACDA